MVLKNIGYIICESAIAQFTDTNIIEEKNGKVIGEGILQTANEKNRNGRFYSSEELFPQLTAPRTLELLEAGYLRAELGHPLSNELVRQQTIDDTRTCAQFLKLWTEGDNVWGRFRGTNNAFGASFDADLRDGCKPAWSLRALGTLVQTPRGAEVKKLRVITWDQVIYPSHPGAYTHNIITESAGSAIPKIEDAMLGENANKIIPITNQQVIDYIKSESANLKFVEDQFGDYVNIHFNEKTGIMELGMDNGDTLGVSVEKYILNEIREYSSQVSYLRDED